MKNQLEIFIKKLYAKDPNLNSRQVNAKILEKFGRTLSRQMINYYKLKGRLQNH